MNKEQIEELHNLLYDLNDGTVRAPALRAALEEVRALEWCRENCVAIKYYGNPGVEHCTVWPKIFVEGEPLGSGATMVDAVNAARKRQMVKPRSEYYEIGSNGECLGYLALYSRATFTRSTAEDLQEFEKKRVMNVPSWMTRAGKYTVTHAEDGSFCDHDRGAGIPVDPITSRIPVDPITLELSLTVDRVDRLAEYLRKLNPDEC